MKSDTKSVTHLIFDNNGVLTTSDEEVTYNRVSEFLGISIEELKRLLRRHVKDLDCGKITQDEFYSLILKEGGFDFSLEEFKKIHLGCYVPKPDVQAFVLDLKKRYNLYLLSNFGEAFWELSDGWGLGRLFSRENMFVSSDLGISKPDREIFMKALVTIGVEARNVIFIDDNLENIKSAEEVGLNVIHFIGLENLKVSLDKIGVK